jgi:ABC-2 type transport system ATP-binding protein
VTTPSSNAAAVVTQNLRREYKEVVAVEGLNLEIASGEVFGLLGPNGAGKTTTLSMLSTVLRPTSGTAIVAGHDIRRDPAAVRRSIGVVFQEPTVDTILTGRENMMLSARLFGVPRALRASRINELLKVVDLADRADSLCKTYSGGMRRRIELARGLLHRPSVLFLDEPTLGLDPQTRAHIWEYISSLKRTYGMTVLITTHYMEEADQLCDRVAIIDHGKIATLGTPRELKASLGGDLVRLRLGAPPTDATLAALRGLPATQSVDLVDGWVQLAVRRAEESLPLILEQARGALAVEVRVPTLEDVFLHVTGRAMRADEGGEGWVETAMRHMRG